MSNTMQSNNPRTVKLGPAARVAALCMARAECYERGALSAARMARARGWTEAGAADIARGWYEAAADREDMALECLEGAYIEACRHAE